MRQSGSGGRFAPRLDLLRHTFSPARPPCKNFQSLKILPKILSLAPPLHLHADVRTLSLSFFLLVASASAPLLAQEWGVGFSSGPFIFGDFAERTSRITDSTGNTVEVTSSLSADTSAGAMLHVERFFNDRFSARADATFTRAPLAVSTERDNEDPVALTVGDMDVTTLALTGALRFNRGGRIRPFVFAGPAYVMYDFQRDRDSGAIPIFSGGRNEFAIVGGLGAEWWLSDRLALRAEASDTYSEAPLEKSDFGAAGERIEIKRPHHLHTTIGMTYRF